MVYPSADQSIAGLARADRRDRPDGPAEVGLTLAAPRLGEIGVSGRMICDRAFSARRYRHAEPVASLDDLSHLAGAHGRLAPHLVEDALTATALALAYGTPPEAISPALAGFKGGEHRLEVVDAPGPVRFVDDSKATNAHAAAASLAGFEPGSVVWIAGGLAKGAAFGELIGQVAGRLKAVVLIGLDPGALSSALASQAPDLPVVRIAPGPDVMVRAVRQARELASGGDTVLLAPASASMDQFASYHDRGRQFAAAVRDLVEDHGT
jgi:UDP-N-acetylmuramoylalanine--D-glutamate ligase